MVKGTEAIELAEKLGFVKTVHLAGSITLHLPDYPLYHKEPFDGICITPTGIDEFDIEDILYELYQTGYERGSDDAQGY